MRIVFAEASLERIIKKCLEESLYQNLILQNLVYQKVVYRKKVCLKKVYLKQVYLERVQQDVKCEFGYNIL